MKVRGDLGSRLKGARFAFAACDIYGETDDGHTILQIILFGIYTTKCGVYIAEIYDKVAVVRHYVIINQVENKGRA